MKKLWYVSGAPASTAAARVHMRAHRAGLNGLNGLTLAFGLGLAAAGGCASSTAAGPSGGGAPAAGDTPAAPVTVGATNANLAGARCHGATCTCRNRHADGAEDPPPDDAHKRFEIRLAATDGTAVMQSPTLGQFTARDEACYYIDVVPGTSHDVTFVARESQPEGGVGPVLGIQEYGPKGPYWYDILEVQCSGPGGKCNRDAADAWGAEAKQRKRGRVDPCGSTVITRLVWDTSGGTGSRELGIFKDFTVKFSMEVKKFPTQFAPGSKECVPK